MMLQGDFNAGCLRGLGSSYPEEGKYAEYSSEWEMGCPKILENG
jgi:hypothetical protein